jgi:glucose/arabinose dehydrogenase
VIAIRPGRGWLAPLLFALLVAGLLAPDVAPAAVQLVQIGDFQAPTYVTAPPGDASRVFVVERAGRVRVVENGVTLATPFLDISSSTTTDIERGLLSMAFAPDYATSGRFWIFYTDAADGTLRIAEGRRDPANPDRALSTLTPILSIPHRQGNHNGGQLAVGPDGDLYIGTGDGGGENDPYKNGQNLTVRDETGASGQHALLGKILRIAPQPTGGYAIPAGNPFPAPAAEVWALGLRNPYRFSFDSATGMLVIADVGQDTVEEVDALAPGVAGANFGWSYREGNIAGPTPAPAGFTDTEPVLVHPHSAGWCSIIGGYVVRDPALPDLDGRYVYGDYCLGKIYAASVSPQGSSGDADLGLPTVASLSSFGEDACGRIYVTSLDGPVYRLAESGDCVLAGPVASQADNRPPRIRVRVNHVQHLLRTGVLQLRVGCDEQCRLRTGGAVRIAIRRARSAATTNPLALPRTGRTLAGGALVHVRVRVSRRTRLAVARALRRGDRRATARVTLRATDNAGNARRRTVLIRVR